MSTVTNKKNFIKHILTNNFFLGSPTKFSQFCRTLVSLEQHPFQAIQLRRLSLTIE